MVETGEMKATERRESTRAKGVEQRKPEVPPTGYIGTDVAAVFRFQLTQCHRR
ncbi:hypothetical protein HanXRQr2_Chr17g0807561 [Helianthus annuus]|uniref:Uncharacterized protein n=1 Tax=Helianthus annuus TaxID=4232 RepID=A0A251SCK9_HELAN|nr:hypothetical protein HanXRQr2_Chr17g0807561 [Helianthus annuus]